MRFTRFYSGSPVCAPSRATFLTGKHTGHAYVRDNKELGGFLDEEERGQLPLPGDRADCRRVAESARLCHGARRQMGTRRPGSTGVPTRHGFDLFFGYLDQKQAHNYYPTHLWKNEARFPLANAYFSPHQKFEGDAADPAAYAKYRGTDYAIDFMTREAVASSAANAAARSSSTSRRRCPTSRCRRPKPPCAPMRARFRKRRISATSSTCRIARRARPTRRWSAISTRRSARCSMRLKEAGSTTTRSSCSPATTAPRSTREARRPRSSTATAACAGRRPTSTRAAFACRSSPAGRARSAPASTSDHIGANWDMWATFAELVGGAAPADRGVSIAPDAARSRRAAEHEALYWEFHSKGSAQAVRMGRWKGVRSKVKGNP